MNNLDNFEKSISMLLDKLSKIENVSPKSLYAGALVLEKRAKEEEEQYADTHFLQNNIRAHEEKNGANVIAHAEYSAYQELGTQFMKAQPYLTPAIDKNSDEIVRAIGVQIQKEIEGKAKGGG